MKPLRIFLSSVQKEFAEERAALRDFLRGDALMCRSFEVFLFEEVPAADRRADSLYLDELDHSDLYLGLFSNKYGFEDADGSGAARVAARVAARDRSIAYPISRPTSPPTSRAVPPSSLESTGSAHYPLGWLNTQRPRAPNCQCHRPPRHGRIATIPAILSK